MRDYLPKAIAYIQENGDELERARLAGVLGRSRPEPKVIRTLVTRQNDDGGFPYGMIPGRPSAVTSTATALQWMQDLRLLGSSPVERAAAYLLTVQRPEGAWEESPAIIKYDPPPLARPGHLTSRAYCTALAALWLAALAGPRHEAVVRACGYLRARRDGDKLEDEPVQITALATASFALADGPASPAVGGGMERLNRLAPDGWSPDRLVETLTALYMAGFGADDPLVAWGLRRLLTAQRDDGGWASEQGADRDVDLSLRALYVLLSFGVSSSPLQ